jgi:hypothetical protein
MKRSVLLIKPERKQRIPLPHYLLINGQMLGLMRGNDNVRVALPEGDYAVTVRSAYKFIESTAQVHISEGETLTLTFGDRERWWNWLFNLDLMLWLFKWFFDFGNYWDIVYEVASNGFFFLWLLRIWIIRKHYFRMTCSPAEKQ